MKPSIRFAALMLVGLAASASAATASAEHLHYFGHLCHHDASLSDHSHYDAYTVYLHTGDHVHISMMSWEVDSYLLVECPHGDVIYQDDDSGSGVNAAISFRVRTCGYYRILANTCGPEDVGHYELVIDVH